MTHASVPRFLPGSGARRRRAAGAVLVLTALLAPAVPAAAQSGGETTRVVVRLVPSSDPVAQARTATQGGGRVSKVYDSVFPGYAASVPAADVSALKNDPAVLSVEVDGTVRATATQAPAPWGLDRMDQAALPLSNSYTYPIAGQGVTAYVIDTGLNAGHAEFAGRVGVGTSMVADGSGTSDCNGHGTHVAGVLGGSTYGVAKGVTVVPVRVLDCAGTGKYSDLVAGIDWIIADHRAGEPAVANLSLGGPPSSTLDAAVAALVADGVSVSVAAGNDGADACNTSPARAPQALTVGATDRNDARPGFSNDGPCLDVFAPGVGVPSAWFTGSTATQQLSGTSVAAPHVAGAAAVLLAQDFTLSPNQVATALTAGATPGVVTGARAGTPDRELRLVTLPRPAASGVDVFYALVQRR